MTSLLLLALLAQGAVPTEKEAEKAWQKLKEDCTKTDVKDRVAAVKEALKTHHEKIIKAMEELLNGDSDPVRLAIAETLGTVDHPATADVLNAGLQPNVRKPEVYKAILKTIGELGWQSAVSKLNDLLPRYTDGEINAVLPEILGTIGQLRSLSSVDPLIDLLLKMETPIKKAGPNDEAIQREAEVALRGILGEDFKKSADWRQWWTAYKGDLRGMLLRTYWVRKTQTRVQLQPADKVPLDGVLVGSRLPPGKQNIRRKGPK
jgi:HEAT repeat protein